MKPVYAISVCIFRGGLTPYQFFQWGEANMKFEGSF